MNNEDFRDRVDDPILSALYEYWTSLRPADRMPSRKDIDPVDIPREALPYVVLAEVDKDNGRIRYRLVGTVMVDEWGADFTGKYVDELNTGTYRDFLLGLFQDVMDKGCAVFSESTFRWDVGKTVFTRRLFMPLATDGTQVDMFLIGQTFERVGGLPENPQKVFEVQPEHTEIVRIHEIA